MIAAAAVLLALVTLAFLSGRVTSRESLAQSSEPPPPGPVTVEVESRVLREALVGRGVVAPVGSLSVPFGLAPPAGRGIITRVGVAAGDSLTNGQLVADVAGHPVFALQAPFASYRDIDYLAEGPDVAAVQSALSGLGYTVPGTGTFDARTARALRQLYSNAGYKLPEKPRGSLDPAAAPVVDPYLPMADWVAVPDLPKVVEEIVASVGQDVAATPATLTVTGSARGLQVRLDPAALDALQPAQTVVFTPDAAGADSTPVELIVTEVIRQEADGGTDAGQALLHLLDQGATLPALRTPGRLEAVLVQTEEVLAVPAAALRSGRDGQPELLTADGRHLSIRVGRSAAGWVEIDGAERGVAVVLP
jgi:peptidoglycan hydrolase-like protein with peptidoglycan-binding domain